jgi:hypothetical protein
MPLEEGTPMVVGQGGPEERFGWGVRLERFETAWRIAGINDVGDRERIDWIRFGEGPPEAGPS